jgi:hypothetical protein
MVLRSIFRAPMGVFDTLSAYRFSYPRAMNFFMMYGCIFFTLFLGKGYEKMTMRGKQGEWENARRSRRFFMPYSLVSYKWRFPKNQ